MKCIRWNRFRKNCRRRSVFSLKKKEFYCRRFRSSHWTCSMKNGVLRISHNSQENTCARVSFSIMWEPADYKFIKKETLAQVFSWELRKISKNIFCIEHLPILLLSVLRSFTKFPESSFPKKYQQQLSAP